MLDLILSGCNGRMGRVLEALCADQPDLHIAAGFDILGDNHRDFSSPAECTIPAQVVVDFSHPAALTGLLGYCVKRQLPVVLATTGYSEDQLLEIESAARTIPVFRSANFSLGINVLAKLARQAAQLLGEDFDIEIVERHHNKKVDAPSGTALLLADALSPAAKACTPWSAKARTACSPDICPIWASTVPGPSGRAVIPSGSYSFSRARRCLVICSRRAASSRGAVVPFKTTWRIPITSQRGRHRRPNLEIRPFQSGQHGG